ncbi:MAG: guanylyl cyclase [Proteobacteria bacterium]|nr:guanylyl cyclase [Pseudomonadota bacterium]
MQGDEAATVTTLESHKQAFFELIKQHRGRVVDSPGDNLLAEFASVVDAVQCAVAVQKELQARNSELPENRHMLFRIGVNLGDVIEEGDRIYGDGVNIAARLESIADPGGVCVSKTAFDHIESKLPLGYEFLGEQTVKNIAKPVGAYRVVLEPRVTKGKGSGFRGRGSGRRMALVAVAAVLVAAFGIGLWQAFVRLSVPPVPPVEKANLRMEVFAPPDRVSVAVLPFQNMTGDPQQEYFSEGMAEQIIAGLSQTPDIYVSARTSSFAFKGKAITAQQIAEQLRVRYLLEGSVQRDAARVRINIQLIDGRDGRHIWAKRYDDLLEDLFALQDRITMEVMEALNVQFIPGITETNLSINLKQYRPSSLRAYEAYLKGVNLFFRRTIADAIAARKLFEEAVTLDPNFAAAYRTLGFSYLDDFWYRLTATPEKSVEMAEQAAEKFSALSPGQPPPHGLLSMIRLVRKDFAKAVWHAEKAVEQSPNDPGGYYSLALALRFAERFEEAIKAQETSFRLSPLRPLTWINNLAWAHLGSQHYDRAISLYLETIERSPDSLFAFQGLAIAYELSGDHEKARWAAENVMRIDPAFSLVREEKMALIVSGAYKQRIFDAWLSAGLK